MQCFGRFFLTRSRFCPLVFPFLFPFSIFHFLCCRVVHQRSDNTFVTCRAMCTPFVSHDSGIKWYICTIYIVFVKFRIVSYTTFRVSNGFQNCGQNYSNLGMFYTKRTCILCPLRRMAWIIDEPWCCGLIKLEGNHSSESY